MYYERISRKNGASDCVYNPEPDNRRHQHRHDDEKRAEITNQFNYIHKIPRLILTENSVLVSIADADSGRRNSGQSRYFCGFFLLSPISQKKIL